MCHPKSRTCSYAPVPCNPPGTMTPPLPNAAVREARYQPVYDAILEVLPLDGEGLTFPQLVQAIRPLLPTALFPQSRTVQWYARTVQRDLEQRHLVRRAPDAPRRLLRSPLRLANAA